MKKKIFIIIVSLGLLLSACSGNGSSANENLISASGTISAKDVNVSSEISGKAAQITVEEGQTVSTSDMLFLIEDDYLQLQYNQAAAALDAAQTTLTAAQTQVEAAKAQYEIALQGARFAEMESRQSQWLIDEPTEIELPGWYFDKSENINALQVEVEAARAELEVQRSKLKKEQEDISSEDFIDIERRLSEAQTTLKNAQLTLAQTQSSSAGEELKEIAQEEYDTALAELESVQLAYERLLNTEEAKSILEARAQTAYAQARLDNALDLLMGQQTGEESLQVKAAKTAVDQAESAVEQAKANQYQAEAALDLVMLQIEKTEVYAPIDGIILSRNLEQGEFVSPGKTVFVIGKLESVNLTVYIPEDQYGKISLGQNVDIRTDSFPEEIFEGMITHIADEAEFTPRNVQTYEGRKTTVYAIKVTIDNPDLKLKPGMPVDVEIVID